MDRFRFLPLFFSLFARAFQCPRLRAQRSAESPRRALVAPKESQQRARIVRGTEQLERRAADTERRTQCTGMSATRAGRSKGDSVTRAGGATSAARAGRARPNSRGPLEQLPLEGASRAMDNLGVPVKRHVVGDL